jgi:hypothetical protein
LSAPIPAPIFSAVSDGNQGSFASNGYVEFSGLHSFNKVVLGSTSNAFEIDNISAGTIPSAAFPPITGTLSVRDADIGDTLTAFVTGNATSSTVGRRRCRAAQHGGVIAAANVTFDSMLSNGGTAVLQWTYHPTNVSLDFLHAGDVLKIKFVAEGQRRSWQYRKPAANRHAHRCDSANASTISAAGP